MGMTVSYGPVFFLINAIIFKKDLDLQTNSRITENIVRMRREREAPHKAFTARYAVLHSSF